MAYTEEMQLKTKERLAELRKEHDITSNRMPAELEEYMTGACLLDYEETNPEKHQRYNKTKGMNIEKLVALADYYDVSTDYLLGRTDTRSMDYEIRELANYLGSSTEVIDGLKSIYDDVIGADNALKHLLDSRYSILLIQSIMLFIAHCTTIYHKFDIDAEMSVDYHRWKLNEQGLGFMIMRDSTIIEHTKHLTTQVFEKLMDHISLSILNEPDILLDTEIGMEYTHCDALDQLYNILRQDKDSIFAEDVLKIKTKTKLKEDDAM